MSKTELRDDLISDLRQRSELLSVRETAVKLGKCDETIRRWGKSGKLPVIRMEGGYRIDPKTLAAFLEARRVA